MEKLDLEIELRIGERKQSYKNNGNLEYDYIKYRLFIDGLHEDFFVIENFSERVSFGLCEKLCEKFFGKHYGTYEEYLDLIEKYGVKHD